MEIHKMFNIILFGAPGSGKGTQAKLLADKYNLHHVSTGDLLRSEVTTGSQLGLYIKSIIDQGNLVSDQLIFRVLEEYIIRHKDNTEGFIFDGYPRRECQCAALSGILSEWGGDVNLVLLLEVPEEIIIKRLLNRANLEMRVDDNIETIKHRLDIYVETTMPAIEFYRKWHELRLDTYGKKNGEFHAIDNSGDDIFETFNAICKVIDSIKS